MRDHVLIPERRLRYRTATDLLSATAIDLEGRKIPGHVFDLSAGGMGLFFERRVDPGWEAGNVLWLCLKSPLLTKPLVTPAQIRRTEECDLGRLLGFRFLDWMGLLSQIPTELANLFNRRREHRLRFDPLRPIPVTVEGLPAASWDQVFGGLKGVLLDISLGGLSFRVDLDIGSQVEPRQVAEVSFALDGSTELFKLWVEIQRCASGPDGIFCGALFDADRTEDFPEKREKLATVLGCGNDLL